MKTWKGMSVWTAILFLNPSLLGQWPARGGLHGNYQCQTSDEKGATSTFDWTIPCGISDGETVIDENSLYIAEADFTESGEDAHRISALNLENGHRLWETLLPERSFVSQDISDEYPVRPLATPVFSQDKIFCAGFGGSVRALDRKNGNLIWSKDLVEEYGATPIQYGVATSPLLRGDRLIVSCGGPKALVLCLNPDTGVELWRAGTGAASYASFVPFEGTDGSKQIVWAAGDEIIALNEIDGTIVWRYPYPETGLTNAVTPINVAPGKLLVAGQGVNGIRLLSVSPNASVSPDVSSNAEDGYQVRVEWKLPKSPFYCNWVQLLSHPDRVVGFAGSTLNVLDWKNGKVVSQLRGWTDCNVLSTPEHVIAIRGDGFIGRLRLINDQLVLESGISKVNDRVWMTPSLVHRTLFVRGRHQLHAIPLDSFTPMQRPPDGSEINSMDAMYGNPPEAISELLNKVKEKPSELTWEDFDRVARDRSLRISDKVYARVVQACIDAGTSNLANRILETWNATEPNSIKAFESMMDFYRLTGNESGLIEGESRRLVKVQFIVRGPKDWNPLEPLHIAGVGKSLGEWKDQGLQLASQGDGVWTAEAIIPKGDLQFKVNGGSLDRFETRADGRRISNRRIRIQEPRSIEVDVARIPPPPSKDAPK